MCRDPLILRGCEVNDPGVGCAGRHSFLAEDLPPRSLPPTMSTMDGKEATKDQQFGVKTQDHQWSRSTVKIDEVLL